MTEVSAPVPAAERTTENFAIREEEDLEDSGAYGTTPSRKDDTLKRGDDIAMLVCSTNYEEEEPLEPMLS